MGLPKAFNEKLIYTIFFNLLNINQLKIVTAPWRVILLLYRTGPFHYPISVNR